MQEGLYSGSKHNNPRPSDIDTGGTSVILAALLLLIGLLAGITATQMWDLRLSGVVVIPLFAVYTLYELSSLPVLLVSVLVAYWGIDLVTSRTLLYGRRLLYVAILVGAIVPLLVAVTTSVFTNTAYSIEMHALGSVLPGIAAYNLYRVDAERRIDDVVASMATYLSLIAIGVAFVSETTLSVLGDSTAPVLFAASADVAQFRGAAIPLQTAEVSIDPAAGAVVVFLGFLAAMWASEVWNIRLLGIIALPLLAIFTIAEPRILLVYLALGGVTYAAIEGIHRQTLLYGRVLLSLAIVTSILLAVGLATTTLITSGQFLLFTAVLAGIGAYNLHRLSETERNQSIGLSAGVYVVFVGIVAVIAGSVPGPLPVVAVGSLLGVGAASYTAIGLERRRRRERVVLDRQGVAS